MFGITAGPAVCPAYPQARIKPESRRAVGIKQLDRRAPLPVYAVVAGVDVYARGSVKKVFKIRYQRDAGYGQHRIVHKVSVTGIIDDVGVHAVIDDLAVDAACRPAGPRGLAVR